METNTTPNTHTENNTPSETVPQMHDIRNNQTLMAVLAYLGLLILIPFLMSRENSFVKFHLKQGLVLLICEALVWVIRLQTMFMFAPVFGAINIALFILAIIGIIHAFQGKENGVPLLGGLARYIHI